MPSNYSSSSTRFVVRAPLNCKPTSVSLPGDLIIFQYEQSCVFVKPAESYQDAIDVARKEFDELVHIPPDRLAFTLEENSSGKRSIRISEGAWSTITSKLPQGSVVNILIRPDLDMRVPPPQYLDVPNSCSLSKSKSGKEIERTPSRGSTRSTKSSSGRSFPWIGVGK
ncbi:hypothetical protein CPB84DRAFT_1781521 [Gymnopilus junonius]|uniref:Uncharacterized protein n=1 Tax=Gymnopilus junonius TaxID=109634 RepID=A0A9P5TL97_GYMJU|nr:hypothetical protein CPB84DRAFT_1781521 [Gymnopilus junonius]